MKEYIRNSEECRRKSVLSAYNAKPREDRIKHLCCDICSKSCICGSENCSNYEHPYNSYEEDSSTCSSDEEVLFSDDEFL